MVQYVNERPLSHCMHRDTIRQAITFVGSCFIKRETRNECFMALWYYFDVRTADNSFNLSDCSTTHLFAVLRKEIQELHKDVFGCDQVSF